MTILLFTKKIKNKTQITEKVQGEYLVYYLLVALMQIGFIGCMFISFISDDAYIIYANTEYSVLLAKFFSSCALHLMLYPEIARSMQLMKYIVNHQEKFTNPLIAFLVAFISLILNVMTEWINIGLLLY